MKEVEKKDVPEVSGGLVGDSGEITILPSPLPVPDPLLDTKLPSPQRWQEV